MPTRRSEFEYDFENRLKGLLLGFGAKIEYEGIKIKYIVPDKLYIPDFVLTGHNGKKMFIETKGWFKPADRTKMRRVKEQHPELDIRFVFQRAKNKLGPKRAQNYIFWCQKWGFKWADNEFPTEWVKELTL